MTTRRRSALRPRALPLLAAALLLAACGGGAGADPGPPGKPPREVEFDFVPGGPIPDSELGEFHVVLECSAERKGPDDMVSIGSMTFTLWPDVAPKGVRRFLRHCAEGTYDGAPFHRVLREFVVQGGDPRGRGTAQSGYGVLTPELTVDPERRHGYGVLSLTEPPSLQFFVCVAESPQVWALDERPISRIGRLTGGVQALETIAGVDVAISPAGGERSAPTQLARVDRALVVRGPAPEGEPVRRPPVDLQGQPEVVAVKQILVTFTERGQAFGVNRNRIEAEARAKECLARLLSGELSWDDAYLEYEDQPRYPGIPPKVRRISNFGVLRLEGQRARIDAQRELSTYRAELRTLLAEGVISTEELTRRQDERAAELADRVLAIAMERREDVNEIDYSEVAFGLELGEVGLVEYDPYTCPAGWFVLLRVE